MANWHKRKAGLASLYEPHSELWKVVIDRGLLLSTCFLETTKEGAEKIRQAQGGTIIPPNKEGERQWQLGIKGRRD